jgi:predicted transcriptional regulator
MAMTLRLTPEQDKQLAEIAAARGISKNRAVADAVTAFIDLEFQRIKIKMAFDYVLEHDAELLQLLGDN